MNVTMLVKPHSIRRLLPLSRTLHYHGRSSSPKGSLSALFSSASNASIGNPSPEASPSHPDTDRGDRSDDNMGLYRLLTPKERELLLEQRQLKETCKRVATQVLLEGTSDDHKNSKLLSQLNNSSFLDLEASFSVVIAGEFNAGKSTLINALLGQKLLESGALPTTDSITIVASSKHNETGSPLPLGVVWHTVPNVPVLTDLTLIDTPGTNSTWLDHTERTLRLLPSADLILFVTSADRPFSESERTLLKGIQAFRKNIVIVVNKMDILNAEGGDHGKDAKKAVVDFVMERSSELLGARPVVIPLSARDALSAKLMEKKNDEYRSNVWHRSQFGALESFLKDSLTTQAKLQSKLLNPIGVAEGVMRECIQVLDGRSEELKADIATLNVLQTQFRGWRKELMTELQGFQQSTTELVRNQGERWKILLHRMNFSSFHYNVLLDHPKFDQEWEETRLQVSMHGQKSVRDDILEHVESIADLVATRGRAQGQAVIEYLGLRPATKSHSLVGSITAASRFEDTRNNLSERLSSAVKSTLRPDEEIKEKVEVFRTLWTTALVSSGLQLGALGTAIGTVMDLLELHSGILVAASLAASGGACYVIGTSRVAQTLDAKWLDKAKNLEGALVSICDKEVERVSRRILDGVGPYTRYVENETERVAILQEQCEGLCAASHNLRNRIRKEAS